MPSAVAAPRLLITMGDVAGIGPEIIARAWPELCGLCRPVVVGDPDWLRWAFDLVGGRATVVPVRTVAETTAAVDVAPCLPATEQDLQRLVPGQVTAAGGRAAFEFLCAAIDLTLAGAADGIVTAP